ncbi:DNA-directed RNA polymerase subunit RPC12/RpoP [Granulicella aggregans]|uniref:DNA-directed RNA polymerase subunit RPC12/RpoP n=1 Tax=Granulicella aggregans TaxID=474949 RepID=A0A7W7Z8S3_9BACT|nr:DNA-directed RNA polymerase subunit RPC12/RpoP [Granulicella aggregans]
MPLLASIAEAYNRPMTMTILKCVACGKTILVRDEPNEKRQKTCTCSASMVERNRLRPAC